MEKKTLKKWIKPTLLIGVLLLFILISSVHAQTATTPSTSTGGSSLIQGFCSGPGTSTTTSATSATGQQTGGVIPNADILSSQANGEQTVLNISLLIMLVMLLIVSIMYMIGYVFSLPALKEMVKVEIGEVFITGLIVLIFVGSFLGISAATTQNYFSVAGSNFGRNVFVDDCGYLSASSVSILQPFFQINIFRYVIEALSSLTIKLEPTYFGFSVKPLAGYMLFDNLLAVLDDAAGAFILLNLGTLLILGIIYALFPLFLYAGIILRTIPWTRAAGGAFLGIFIGFYIVFPLLLHLMLGGYSATLLAPSTGTTGTTSTTTQSYAQQIINQLSGQSSGTGAVTAVSGILSSTFSSFGLAGPATSAVSTYFSSSGVVGGFIANVIEPSLFTLFSIIVSFIIAIDIAEVAGDMLGAPSLSAGNIFSGGVRGGKSVI
jgi:hypothetical protein